MNKLLFSFCLFICTTSIAQTKEETIEWLKNNKESLLPVFSCDNINGSETATFNLEIKNDSLVYVIDYDGKAIWTVAFKDILYQDVNKIVISPKPYYDACEDLIYFILQSAENKIIYHRYGSFGVEIAETDSIFDIVFNKSKKEDAMKFLKAIMQLAKLNGAKANK